MTFAPEVTVWTTPARAAAVGRVLDLLGDAVRPLAVAGPRSEPLDGLAARLGLRPGSDFRQMRVDHPAAFVLVADRVRPARAEETGGVAHRDLAAAVRDGTRAVCLEPPLASLLSTVDAAFAGHPGAAVFAPAFTAAAGWRAAADPERHLGPPRLIRMTHLGRPDEGSMFARLYDAWLTVLRFTPRPEWVTASRTHLGGAGRAARAGRDDDPGPARGLLAAHGAVPAGPGVVLQVGDAAAATRRHLSVLADGGQLEVDANGYRLRGADGDESDSAEPGGDAPRPAGPGAGSDGAGPDDYAQAVADQWRRLLDRPASAADAPDPQRRGDALACAEACLLSCRTGQPESPGHLLHLAGRG